MESYRTFSFVSGFFHSTSRLSDPPRLLCVVVIYSQDCLASQYVNRQYFTHSIVDGHLSCVQLGTITKVLLKTEFSQTGSPHPLLFKKDLYCGKIHIIFAILTIFKCMTHGITHEVSSHCYATITTICFQKVFITSNRKYVPKAITGHPLWLSW